MKRTWPLVAVGLAATSVACWNFEGAYDECVSSGRCDGGGGGGGDGGDGGGGGGDGGGGDAGDSGFTCPSSNPSGNGLCFMGRYDRAAPMYGIYGFVPDRIFFGGEDEAISFWDGNVLSDDLTGLPIGNLVYDLNGPSPSELWAATVSRSSSYYVYRYDGSRWNDVTPANFSTAAGDCRGVWTEDGRAAYVACDQGLWSVSLPSTGQVVANPAGFEFKRVWGIPSGPVWAVGGDPTAGSASIWERRGGVWQELAFPSSPMLRGVHGRNDHDVWAVGDNSLLMHLDDGGWSTVSSALREDMQDVFVTPSGETWVTSFTNRVMVIAPDGTQRQFVPPGIPLVPDNISFKQVQVFDTGDVWITALTDDGGTFYNGAEFHYRKL